MPLVIDRKTINEIVSRKARSPYQINYFNHARVLEKIVAQSAVNESLTLEQLINNEFAKLDGDRYDLMELGYSPDEYASFSLIKRSTLKTLKCEPEEIKGLSDIQAEAFALGVPRASIVADWFDANCLRAAKNKVPCELAAVLGSNVEGASVELMDELLARLALKLATYPEADREVVLSNWNDSSHVSGKDLRIHLSLLSEKNKSPAVARVMTAIKSFHTPQFTGRGLFSFTKKILKLAPLEPSNALARELNTKLDGLKALAGDAALPLVDKFTGLLSAYDIYQQGRAVLGLAPSPRLFRSPSLGASTGSTEEGLDGFALGAPACGGAGGASRST